MIFVLDAGALSLDPEREEKLSTCQVSQLASRVECRPDDVFASQNRENGAVHD